MIFVFNFSGHPLLKGTARSLHFKFRNNLMYSWRDNIFASSCVQPMIHSIWHSFFLRNPLESYEEAIKVPLTDTSFEEDILIMVLNRLGFRKTTYINYSIFLPCPLGTFSNYTLLTLEPSVEICIDCPPGMLYLIPENIIETAGIPKKVSSLTRQSGPWW